jgi:hypothetical protein
MSYDHWRKNYMQGKIDNFMFIEDYPLPVLKLVFPTRAPIFLVSDSQYPGQKRLWTRVHVSISLETILIDEQKCPKGGAYA